VAGLIPAFTISMGILFTILYPLGREDFKKISSELEARRKAKAESAEITQ
jgi:Na+/melibiose symporter-like transporter